MPQHLLAFDPGQTTGFCHIAIADDDQSFQVVNCFEIVWTEALSVVGDIFATVGSHPIVLIETFRLFPHKAKAQIGSAFPSVRMTGVIETYAFIIGVDPKDIKWQEPSDIQRVQVLAEHVKSVSGSPHKIDAYKHARLYYLKHFYSNPFSVASDNSLTEKGVGSSSE